MSKRSASSSSAASFRIQPSPLHRHLQQESIWLDCTTHRQLWQRLYQQASTEGTGLVRLPVVSLAQHTVVREMLNQLLALSALRLERVEADGHLLVEPRLPRHWAAEFSRQCLPTDASVEETSQQ